MTGVTASSGTGAILSVSELRCSFDGVNAVDGVSFEIAHGTTVGLIGPNGAGKSTVCNIIAGTIKSSSGHVVFDGHDITDHPPFRVARDGLIRTFQLSAEFRRMTVLENLVTAGQNQRGESLTGALLGRWYWGRQERELVARARQLLERVGLWERRDDYAGNLSGGQRRILEILRALMTEPTMLLLDEPMAGVHPDIRSRIADQLEELAAEGLTMLMVEHELETVERLCDSVIVMAQGRIVSIGAMEDIWRDEAVLDAYLVG